MIVATLTAPMPTHRLIAASDPLPASPPWRQANIQAVIDGRWVVVALAHWNGETGEIDNVIPYNWHAVPEPSVLAALAVPAKEIP